MTGSSQCARFTHFSAGLYLLLAQVHARQDNSAVVVADLDAHLRLDDISPRAEKARNARAGAQNALLQQSNGSALAKVNP